MKRYAGIDCGGTNLRIYEVNPETGELIKDLLEKKIDLREINENSELVKIVFDAVKKINSEEIYIGCAAAGNVNEEALILIQSPNSGIKKPITFAKSLREQGHKVTLINDMKAAAIGAYRFGQGRGLDNVLVATYSSGYNCMKTSKGKLIQGISPEFGHQPYHDKKSSRFTELKCGCGGFSHLDPAVSGNGAANMARKYFKEEEYSPENLLILKLAHESLLKETDREFSVQEIHNAIKAEHVYRAFRQEPLGEPQKSIREVQVRAIAESFARMLASYNPLDIIICMGSQAEKDGDLLITPAAELFCNKFDEFCMHSLNKPKIVINNLSEIGVRGAVAYIQISENLAI